MRKIVFGIVIFFVGIFIVSANEEVSFVSCVDGDTFKVKIDGAVKSVRLLAVDTPESVHPSGEVEYYGKEASKYTCDIVSNAKMIELEYDEASDIVDKYDRILAWVYVDGSLLQELLISNGYAEVAYLYDDYKYTSLLKEKENYAKDNKLGIWGSESEGEYNQVDFYVVLVLIIIVVVIFWKKRKGK